MAKRLRADEGPLPDDLEAMVRAVRRRVQQDFNGHWELLTPDVIHSLITPKLQLESPLELVRTLLLVNRDLHDTFMSRAYPAFLEEMYDRHYRSPFPPHERYRTAVFVERMCELRYRGRMGNGVRMQRANAQYGLMSLLIRHIGAQALRGRWITPSEARNILRLVEGGGNSPFLNKNHITGLHIEWDSSLSTFGLFDGANTSGLAYRLPPYRDGTYRVQAPLDFPLANILARWHNRPVLEQQPDEEEGPNGGFLLVRLDAEFALIVRAHAFDQHDSHPLLVMAKAILLDGRDRDDAFLETCAANEALTLDTPDTKVVYYRNTL
jgi:hypothetical protein